MNASRQRRFTLFFHVNRRLGATKKLLILLFKVDNDKWLCEPTEVQDRILSHRVGSRSVWIIFPFCDSRQCTQSNAIAGHSNFDYFASISIQFSSIDAKAFWARIFNYIHRIQWRVLLDRQLQGILHAIWIIWCAQSMPSSGVRITSVVVSHKCD